MAAAKKRKEKKENALEDVALVMGTQQNLSNLYSLDIYGPTLHKNNLGCPTHRFERITKCKLAILSESAVCKKFLGQICSYPASL